MEMSPAYMDETARAMEKKGYALAVEPLTGEVDGEVKYTGTRFTLTAEEREFQLEALTYGDDDHTYFLQIVNFHGMRTFSFPLDSWKHRDNRVEFKFVADKATAQGLAFILPFEEEDG